MKPYIQDTNDLLKKIANLPSLSDDLIFCTIDAVDLYPNKTHEEELIAIKEALDIRKDPAISTGFLIKLAECVIKNKIFERENSIFNQLKETEMRNKMMPSYAIIFMDSLEEKVLS